MNRQTLPWRSFEKYLTALQIVKCTTTRSVICKINLDWIRDSKCILKSFEKNLFLFINIKQNFLNSTLNYFLIKQFRIKTLRMKCIPFLTLLCIIWFFPLPLSKSITYTYRKKASIQFFSFGLTTKSLH